jgi:hypothetical protein
VELFGRGGELGVFDRFGEEEYSCIHDLVGKGLDFLIEARAMQMTS